MEIFSIKCQTSTVNYDKEPIGQFTKKHCVYNKNKIKNKKKNIFFPTNQGFQKTSIRYKRFPKLTLCVFDSFI